MKSEIENSKVVVVSGLINTTDGTTITANIPLSQFISLEFVPDYAILKYVSVVCKNATDGAFNVPLSINSDLGFTYNNTLVSVLPVPVNNIQTIPAATPYNNVYYNFCNQQCDVHIKLPNFVNKNYNFTVTSSSPVVDQSTFLYVVGLTFEFIKFKKPFMLPEPK